MLVDQRGTGGSNRLDCAIPDDALETGELSPAQLAALARECLAKLPGRPQFYTTSIAVQRPRRRARGARLRAGEPLRRLVRHARRATLRAPLPGPYAHRGPGRRRARRRSRSGRRSPSSRSARSTACSTRCAADPACNARFPDLPGQFAALDARAAPGAGPGHARRSGHGREPARRRDAHASPDDGAHARLLAGHRVPAAARSSTRRRPAATTSRSPRRPRCWATSSSR